MNAHCATHHPPQKRTYRHDFLQPNAYGWFPCAFCHRSFYKKPDLYAHELRVHGKSTKRKILRPWMCTKCNETFSVKESALRHVERFHGDRANFSSVILLFHVKYPCAICGKESTCKSSLKKHLRNVHKAKNYGHFH